MDGKKTVVVTGASRGIGKAVAEFFLKKGWKVVGTSTTGKGWEHPSLLWVQLDLAYRQSISHAAQEISAHAPIDVLINNAGILSSQEDTNPDDHPLVIDALTETLQVNLIGTIDLTEHLVPLVASGGSIISMGSRLGVLTTALEESYAPAYAISKAGLSMYTCRLARRLMPHNITVSIMDPRWIRTDMGGEEAPRLPEEFAPEVYDLATRSIPTGKFWRDGKERTW